MKNKMLFVGLAALLGLVGCDSGMEQIEDKVAKDSVEQYNLAVKGGDPIEICTYAGMVVAAYNQAKDEENYLKWKEIEKRDCRKAGLK